MSGDEKADLTPWTLEPLGEVAEVHLGKTPKKSDYRDEGIHRIVKFRDVRAGKLDLSNEAAGFVADDPNALKGLRALSDGDVLVTASAHSGDQIGKKCAFVSDLPSYQGGVYYVGELLRVAANPERMEPEWPFLWFSSTRGRAAVQTAVAGVHLTQGRARKIPIPVPGTREEQLTTIARLREALERSAVTQRRLSDSRLLVRRLRQALLRAAVTGRLTEDWRARRPDENGAEVIAEVARVRRERGDRVPDDSSPEGPEAIPEAWEWARVEQIATVKLGGTPARGDASFWGEGIPWVSSGEVANCRITSTEETITDEGLAGSSAKLYPAGSVLIAMIGEGKTRGQSAILDIEAATNQNAAGLVFDTEAMNSEYVWRWALAEYSRTRAVGRGGAQLALNKQKVANLLIPVPPRPEQDEIAKRLQAALGASDALGDRIANGATELERAIDRVLTEAFAPAFNGGSAA